MSRIKLPQALVQEFQIFGDEDDAPDAHLEHAYLVAGALRRLPADERDEIRAAIRALLAARGPQGWEPGVLSELEEAANVSWAGSGEQYLSEALDLILDELREDEPALQ
jgi:hypothetical protein